MAANIVYSTLMVILSQSQTDFETFWTQTGSVNDALGTKHEQSLGSVVQEGNFRSSLIDEWGSESFISVTLCATNKFGDILWETEFNTTSISADLTSWFVGNNIVASSAVSSLLQETTLNDKFYSLRTGPDGIPDKSWFAMSDGQLSYTQLPVIYIPTNKDSPFTFPEIKDGVQGCWQISGLINATEMFTDSDITPQMCIDSCGEEYDTAVIALKSECHCGILDPLNPPPHQPTMCYRYCVDGQICGGYVGSTGSAYHIQGSSVPGEVDEITLLTKMYTNVIAVLINGAQISPVSSGFPVFISSVKVLSTPVETYTLQYSYDVCSDAIEMKTVTSDGTTPIIFTANGSISDVDILQVGCLKPLLSNTASTIVLEIFGPDPASEHVLASAVVVIAKNSEGPDTSSTSTSTTSTSSSSSTSTSSTSTTSTTLTTSTSSTSTTTTSTTSTSTTPTTSSTTSSTTSTTRPPPSTSATPTSTTSSTTSASSSQSPSTQTTSSSTTTPSTCLCSCQNNLPQLNITVEELQKKIESIQKKLAVNVSELSSTIRKLSSANDERVSAKSIGYVGIGILVSMFGAILFIDSTMLIRDIGTFFHNISQVCKKR